MPGKPPPLYGYGFCTWHNYFAWFPVQTQGGRWVWGRHIQRRLAEDPWDPKFNRWEYRL